MAGGKYKKKRSAPKRYSPYSVGPGRSGGSGAAGYSARSRAAKKRLIRGSRAGSLASQSVGAGQFLAKPESPPPYTPFEKKLIGLGVSVPNWYKFTSQHRFHVQPSSGVCHWAGVPFELKQGTAVYRDPGVNTDYMPGNCDLFDCARKLLQGVTDNTSSLYSPFPKPMADEFGVASGQQSVTIGSLSSINYLTNGVGTNAAPNCRRWKVAQNKVLVTMENLCTLDAFVEQYDLIYQMPQFGQGGLDRTATSFGTITYKHFTHIGCNVNSSLQSQEDTADTKNYPNWFASREGIPYYPQFYPHTSVTDDVRRYGLRYAAMLLESYAHITLNHRSEQALVDQYEPTTKVYTSVRRADPVVALCHPLNDPCRLWPTGVKNMTGFRLIRSGPTILLKPGMSKQVRIPAPKVYTLDGDSFPRTVDFEVSSAEALANPITNPTRDRVSIPKYIRVRFFRVRGDMITSKSASDTAADIDYQTGSARVQFNVLRSFYMKYCPTVGAKAPNPLNDFDKKLNADSTQDIEYTVPVVDQEAINDETDAPAIVDIAGN